MRTTVLLCMGLILGSMPQASAGIITLEDCTGKSLVAAIQRAQSGDCVQLPEGTFELIEPVRPKSRTKLIGVGLEKTRLVYKGTKAGVLISLNGCEDVEIAHLTLDGQNNPLVQQGIVGNNSRRLWLHHLTIRNLQAETWGPHAILFSGRNPSKEGGVTDSRITDCLIEDIGRDSKWGAGIRLAWGSDRNQILGNVVCRTGRGGIFGDHATDLVIRRNQVSGSNGEGLGIEIWGGCLRSLIEDNMVDHWISVDQGNQSAVRRNVVGDDNTLKGYGIEIIARDMVVSDNVVRRGAHIGLSVSNKPVKNNVYWAYNTICDCIQWGAQLQGESGGIAHHYFYRCSFEHTVRGDPRARYQDGGHGFRTNGNCSGLVFEDCTFAKNGGDGLQFGGRGVDAITLLRCSITGNGLQAMAGPSGYQALEFDHCKIEGNQGHLLPEARPFTGPSPTADFRVPQVVRAGEAVQFQSIDPATGGKIAERLWDFGDGIPEMTPNPKHTFDRPGKHRVTLVVWNDAGRGGRTEKIVSVESNQ